MLFCVGDSTREHCFASIRAAMRTFWQAVGFSLVVALWGGISAQVTPLPEERMNVVSCFVFSGVHNYMFWHALFDS